MKQNHKKKPKQQRFFHPNFKLKKQEKNSPFSDQKTTKKTALKTIIKT